MYTIVIIGLLVTIVFAVISHCSWSEELKWAPVISLLVTLFLFFDSNVVSTEIVPEGYIKIETYSYVTSAGSLETLEGPYYKNGNTYYTQKWGKARWIPFAQCDYVEVDLPVSDDRRCCCRIVTPVSHQCD